LEADEHPAERTRVSILLPLGEAGAVDVGLVEEVVRALYEDEGMREVLAERPDPAAPAYTTLSELRGLPPPEDVPFLTPELGLLSVPTPAGGVKSLEALVRRVAPGASVKAVGTYRALEGGPADEAGGARSRTTPSDATENDS
jgi:hypothetical protein